MNAEPVTLDNCASEPIHLIGRIQSFGFLIALSPQWIITHVSRNVAEEVGREAEALLELPAAEVLAEDAIHALRARLQMRGTPQSVERIFGLKLFGDDRRFDVALHISGRDVVLEAEPAVADEAGLYETHVRPMAERTKRAGSTEELCAVAARQLRGLTGFDRVMVYRFSPDGSGEVVAESRGSGIDTFLGLHFPANDIPAQARRLYSTNLLRIITDVDDPTVEIVTRGGSDAAPLDLGMSTLRAVSPIHIEYLRNMGVAASLSVSIMRDGQLWGLFACHHYAPLRLSYPMRTAVELFGELFAYMVDQSENTRAREQRARARQLHDTLMARLAEGRSLLTDFGRVSETVGEVIAHDGMVGWIDGQFVSSGEVPAKAEFLELAGFLDRVAAGNLWSTENLSQDFPPAANFAAPLAGVLAIPVSRAPRDYIVLFRSELSRSVRWAGNPEKSVKLGPNGPRLTPRESFAEWQQVVTGRSQPWDEEEMLCAEQLRATLMEVILRLTDAAHRERREHGRRQEILIAELNHRVRNILNLIRSLVNQTGSAAATIPEYADVLGSRIYALARAHDQLTRSHWRASSLRELIGLEARAYLGEAGRITLEGSDPIVEATALTTLSLVFHELITNSAKYGALSVPEGQVVLRLLRSEGGALRIEWQESGGPAVSPPVRRGFGSAIIELSIPHELGGKAEITYASMGVEASFSIPAQHIHRFDDFQDRTMPMGSVDAGGDRASLELPEHVLVVEDNILIAMEAEALLGDLGARNIHIAANVQDALALIEAQPIGLVLLDVNLGSENSVPVAERLRAMGVPFVLSTGYGDAVGQNETFADALVLTKPYSSDDLRIGLGKVLA
ncbi:two-component system sensor histidine kinase/response regulator [Altererythrobacter sp. B11]|uniref:HWE histidine kinase domain-containing protein n=1 Tax=Altererythrobacter sp. B11 TaxID=2060312 RepID=UPI000DC6F7D7|nr:HWE histidine kinase domain-containing protein [Altererythrobacter sp. B11]BBC71535.1 two-component system sensor histidine kinase/response regulator [Altererythrobacter sp. B11]